MSRLISLIREGTRRPGASGRYQLGQAAWADLARGLQDDALPLIGMWADGDEIHALFIDAERQPIIASVAVERQRYLSLSQARPAAALAERMIRDLHGHEAMQARDLRPWLDHGAWGQTTPRAQRPGPAVYPPEPIEFASVEARERRGGTLRIDGPARMGGAFGAGPPWMAAVSVAGGSVIAMEPRLGWGHRGVDSVFAGRPVGAAVRLAARVDAGASVAYALATARAVENAAGFDETQTPELIERRRVLVELERVAGHLHALGRLAESCGETALAADLGIALEEVRSCCAQGWDHRLLFDTVSPCDAAPVAPGLAAIAAQWRTRWAPLARRFEAVLNGPLSGLATIRPATAIAYGVFGVAGQASGQVFDARRPCTRQKGTRQDGAQQEGARFSTGDALARTRVRWSGIGESLALLTPQVTGQSQLALKPAFASVTGEGLGVAEGATGPVWAWVRLEAGLIAAVWFADPSAPLWAVLPEIAPGIAVGALPAALASLAPGLGGVDR